MTLLDIKNFGVKSLPQYLLDTGYTIVFCKADRQYTYVWFTKGNYLYVSSNISRIELFLADSNLFRPHKSYLVNLNYIISIDYDKRSITMEGGHIAKLCEHKVEALKLLIANREKPEVFNFLLKNLVEPKRSR